MFTMTNILIAINVILSMLAFRNNKLMDKLMFYPYDIKRNPKEAFRFITSGFIHADQIHLLFNMITLYFFGPYLEATIGVTHYMQLYLTGIVVANLPSYFKKKDDVSFASVGASGAISAIVFSMIYFYPWQKIYLFFLIGIPMIIYGVLYLIYSFYMSKKGGQGINHDAHFYGAVYGVIFTFLIDPSKGSIFIEQLLN